MKSFLTVGFEYCEKLYIALVREKKNNLHNEYHITIMNGELEKILYGNHIIKEINGCLQLETSENVQQESLKQIIATELGKLLRLPLNYKWKLNHL